LHIEDLSELVYSWNFILGYSVILAVEVIISKVPHMGFSNIWTLYIYIFHYLFIVCLLCLYPWDPLNQDASDCILSLFGKLLRRRGASAWSHGVWTWGAKVLKHGPVFTFSLLQLETFETLISIHGLQIKFMQFMANLMKFPMKIVMNFPIKFPSKKDFLEFSFIPIFQLISAE